MISLYCPTILALRRFASYKLKSKINAEIYKEISRGQKNNIEGVEGVEVKRSRYNIIDLEC